jgi:hypothetical protein
MNATSDKGARLSRDIQAKIGEKLALLYVPLLRQEIPKHLSELSRRLETTARTPRSQGSTLSKMLKAVRRRGSRS